LSGSASADLLDLLKLIAPEDNTLQSLTLSDIKETVGDCTVNLHDYCGKCFSIFPKDERLFISVIQQILMETNVQDCVIVEIQVISLKNRETYIL